MTRRCNTALTFEAMRIEGGLLNGEYLTKIAHQDAPNQADPDYRREKPGRGGGFETCPRMQCGR